MLIEIKHLKQTDDSWTPNDMKVINIMTFQLSMEN